MPSPASPPPLPSPATTTIRAHGGSDAPSSSCRSSRRSSRRCRSRAHLVFVPALLLRASAPAPASSCRQAATKVRSGMLGGGGGRRGRCSYSGRTGRVPDAAATRPAVRPLPVRAEAASGGRQTPPAADRLARRAAGGGKRRVPPAASPRPSRTCPRAHTVSIIWSEAMMKSIVFRIHETIQYTFAQPSPPPVRTTGEASTSDARALVPPCDTAVTSCTTVVPSRQAHIAPRSRPPAHRPSCICPSVPSSVLMDSPEEGRELSAAFIHATVLRCDWLL